MQDKVFYITTPIYYVNDVPHIGHAYTTIACDAMSRYKRMKGFDVRFLTGTDEHGQKIQAAAEALGITPQALVDKIHLDYKELWRKLDISNDDFIRTTDERHIRTVQAMFQRLMDQGDVYKGTYEGRYCVPCETYVPEASMGPNETCPDCGRPLTTMREESYFFRGAKYVPQLIEHYEKHLDGVMPRARYNEIMSFLKGGVRDQSVSRTTLKWGIPVPGDEAHVIYVWFDALVNYASAAGYLDDPAMFRRYWPAVRHVVGKDIIRFHCVVWPLMLLALGLPLPVSVAAHGWWTVNGEKMSKSRGNVVQPLAIVERYGLDAFRYFLLREVPFGSDGDFSEAALAGRINSDLANDLGNLLNRTLQMIESYRGGVVPSGTAAPLAQDVLDEVDAAMERFAFDEALKAIWAFIGRANKYIDETAPWRLAKEPDGAAALDSVLMNLYEALRLAALLIAPVMPGAARRMWAQLGREGDPERDFRWGDGAGARVRKAEILFPRVEPAAHEAQISLDQFQAVEMRVAQVVKCEEIPRSRKLYRLEVDLGYERRVVCSGIKAFFAPQELVGRRVVLVTNLKPARLCGVESNGMILAASTDGNALTLIAPQGDIPLGSRVS